MQPSLAAQKGMNISAGYGTMRVIIQHPATPDAAHSERSLRDVFQKRGKLYAFKDSS